GSIHCLVGGLDVRVVNQKNDTPYRKVGILSRALTEQASQLIGILDRFPLYFVIMVAMFCMRLR
ncbi:hypothetical protein ACLBWS_10950, partial [Brucellaceae bacterium D45D]